LWMKGPTTGSPVTPAFSLDVFVFPDATAAGVSIPTSVSATIAAGAVSTDPDKYYLCEVDIGASLDIPSNAQIQYNIEPSAQPTQDHLILRQGITTYIP